MSSTFRLLVSISVACAATGVQAQANTNPPPPNTTPPVAAPAPLVAPSLQVNNPFDPQRKVWPDRVPPPPPPPPTPVTDQDLQLYGVVIAGPIKRATVKVGKRFAQLAPEGRAFANLSEGQPVGEFTLSKIEPTHLVLKARGGQQLVYFTKKTDRSTTATAPASAPPVQGASAGDTATPTTAAPTNTAANADNTAPAATTTATNAANSTPGNITVGHNGASAATAANNTPVPEVNVANSLAAALAAARSNAAQKPMQPFVNPFTQKR